MKRKRRYKMIARVIESRGKCEAHKVGDVYEWVTESRTREKPIRAPICHVAFDAIFPKVYGMEWGDFPWHEDTFVACCPDYSNLVVFEIKRVPLEE